jgi:hypothetical protein
LPTCHQGVWAEFRWCGIATIGDAGAVQPSNRICESICVWNIRKAGDGAMSNGRESEKTDKQQYE